MFCFNRIYLRSHNILTFSMAFLRKFNHKVEIRKYYLLSILFCYEPME